MSLILEEHLPQESSNISGNALNLLFFFRFRPED